MFMFAKEIEVDCERNRKAVTSIAHHDSSLSLTHTCVCAIFFRTKTSPDRIDWRCCYSLLY